MSEFNKRVLSKLSHSNFKEYEEAVNEVREELKEKRLMQIKDKLIKDFGLEDSNSIDLLKEVLGITALEDKCKNK